MKPIILDDLVNQQISVQIEYIDTDRSTVLHETKFSGRVVKVDSENGITIQPDGDQNATAVIPPSIAACSRDENNLLHVNWLVYRVQEDRTEGDHEWWDWQPKTQK